MEQWVVARLGSRWYYGPQLPKPSQGGQIKTE
jgi:hypothetical protein